MSLHGITCGLIVKFASSISFMDSGSMRSVELLALQPHFTLLRDDVRHPRQDGDNF